MLNAQEIFHYNQLLGGLESTLRASIDGYFEPVTLSLAEIVCEAGDQVEYAYFPGRSVLSLLTVMRNGAAIEIANVGREGAFGLSAALYTRTSFSRCIVEIPGAMVRCPIKVLQQQCMHNVHVRDLCLRYTQTMLSQVQLNMACNAMHTPEARICRWLLMMQDRADGDTVSYKLQFFAHILGVGRKFVKSAADCLQTAGLVHCHRETIRVVDWRGVEDVSCECYAIMKKRLAPLIAV